MVNELLIDPTGSVLTFASALEHQYMLHTFSTGAIVMRWFRDEFCSQERYIAGLTGINAYTLLDKEIEKVAAGSNGLIMLPYLQGSGAPDLNDAAKGVFFGITVGHKKAHFARAAMEGIAMTLKRMVEGTEALGVPVTEIRSLGGGAKSPVWCQIKADVLGLPVNVISNSESAPSLGAAILAGVSAGIWKSVNDCVERFVSISSTYYPNAYNAEIYKMNYDKYRKLYNRLNEVF